MTTAREAIDGFLAGEDWYGDTAPFLRDGRLDPEALALLAAALRSASGDAREAVAEALVEAAQAADPLFHEGGLVIRDPGAIAALVSGAPAARDGAKEVCYSALLKCVPGALLAPHEDALVAELERHADATLLLVVARLKTDRARPAIDRLLSGPDPSWRQLREGKAALAAYGDRLTELAAVIPFVEAQDPVVKSDLAYLLGWMGTPHCLVTLAAALRTPLIHDFGYVRRSCRVEVVAGLRLSFPDEPALFESRFTSDDAYEAAERFVTAKLGVTFPQPRPPFLWKEVQVHGRLGR